MKTKEIIENAIPYKQPVSNLQLGKNIGFIKGADWMQEQWIAKVKGMIEEIENAMPEYINNKTIDLADRLNAEILVLTNLLEK